MTKDTTRAKNHTIKIYRNAARALEHAAREVEASLPYGSTYVTDVDPLGLTLQADELLKHARECAASDPKLAVAWEGELELEV
jgi:hypothetical protein